MTTTFEVGCAAVDQAARSAQALAKAVQRSAAALAKAATSGDIIRMRTEAARLAELGEEVQTATNTARKAWPFSPEEEVRHLSSLYGAELESAAEEQRLTLSRYGRGWSAFPCLITVDAEARVARINRSRVKALRPTALVTEIAKIQNAKPRFRPEQFIEVLFNAYRLVVGADGIGRGATLVDVYRALTILPDARRDYERDEFVRDLHLLNRSGVHTTRNGYALSLAASTGTKTTANLLEIVDERGERHLYFGVYFAPRN
jgi:hypothetical protein